MEEILSQIFDTLGDVFGGFGRAIERSLTSLFGSSNARYLRRLQPQVAAINDLEPKYQTMTDAELAEQTPKFRKRLAAGETLDDLLIEAFAVAREAGRRTLGMRHFDVQLMGGMVLHGGDIAEMVTGEGKTLVATLPAYLNALEGKGVHVVTVNDYLARRDMEWMGPLYMSLGLTIGAIQSNMDTDVAAAGLRLRHHLRDEQRIRLRLPSRQHASGGPGRRPLSEAVPAVAGAAALRDHRRGGQHPHRQGADAADHFRPGARRRHPLRRADRIARQLKKNAHFEVNEKEHSSHLTDDGVRAAEQLAGVESFYTAGNMEWPHLIDNSLKAHHLYKRNVNYVVTSEGEVVIVDEFTGRLMPGRNWSDGLHQAVEAKEGVQVKEENQTLATITLQNFFKLYDKICGMTGTAMTEASEFWKIYKLDVIAIPTNRPLHRVNYPDVIYRTRAGEIHRHRRRNRADAQVRRAGNRRAARPALGQIVRESDDAIEFMPKDSRDRESIPARRSRRSTAAGGRSSSAPSPSSGAS